MYPIRHHKVHPHFGIPLGVHLHTSLCYLLTQHMVCKIFLQFVTDITYKVIIIEINLPCFIGKYTPQYTWLDKELPKVNRTETPWLIVLLHSPWYNSNNYHFMEGESMRVMFESWFVKYKVDIVLAGHVHAYERSVSCSKHLEHFLSNANKSKIQFSKSFFNVL